MKKSILHLALAAFIFYGHAVFAQKTVNGKVLDASNNEALPGASIVIKGSVKGTTTNDKGEFTLEVPQDTTILLVSYLGMNTEEVSTAGVTEVKVLLIGDLQKLMDVVVIGYGTQDKAFVTGSISKIEAKEIQQLPVTSYEQALQGRAPGLQISAPSGELGGAMQIRVRGAASVSASNQPLIVIDDIPVTSEPLSNFVDNNPRNPLADLNPNDIASVEVLKDAAATAIFGSRGANGVILITTKKGLAGKTKFNLNFSTGITEATNVRKFLNRDQYIQMFTDAAKNGGYTAADYGSDTAALNAAWTDYAGTEPSFSQLVKAGTNDDWNKAAYRQGSNTQMDLSAAGGSDKMKFYGSLGYLNQNGIIIRNSFERISGRFNVDFKATKHLTLGINFNQNFIKNGRVPENNSFGSPLQANAIAPIVPLKDPTTGDDNANTYYGNPYRFMNNSSDIANTGRTFAKGYAALNFLKYLMFKTEFGFDYLNTTEQTWNGSKTPNSVATPKSANYGSISTLNYTTNNLLTFTKTFAQIHTLEALIGQSFQKETIDRSYIQGIGLPSDNLQTVGSASQISSASSNYTGYAITSYYARANYRFKDKYLLAVSFRIDGSSRFGFQKQYGYFPAVSLGWIVSEEKFFKGLNIESYLPFLKLKTSYGLTGNSEIDNFASRNLATGAFFGSRGGIYTSQLGNGNLTWENTTQWDAGVEIGALKNRVQINVDFYIKNSDNLLLNRPIPITNGYSSIYKNVGSMRNVGWDMQLITKNLVGKFKWTTNLNFSTYKNTVTSLDGQSILPAGRELNGVIEGQPIGVFYGVKYNGVDPATGDALYQAADGTSTSNYNLASRQVLGSPLPKNFGGIINSFEYMGFDFSFFGQWVYGNQIYNSSGIFQSSNMASFGLDNQTADQINYWKNPGDQTDIPRPDLSVNNGSRVSSRWLYDGSYFRLKTMTLGYTLPENLAKKIKFSTIRVYFTAQNLFTITKYPGNDPEVNYARPDASNQTLNRTSGIDYYNAPQAKAFIFGINLGF